MKGSFRIARVAGIDVYLHATFLLLITWIAFSYMAAGRTAASAAEAIGFILALFACVVLHELGHALAAARYGIQTRDITLYPIGGVARLERMPDDPRQELHVAAAGPAVSLAVGLLLGGVLVLTGQLRLTELATAWDGSVPARLALANLALAAFNLIPAFPMDGGRILRAFLATRMDYERATRIAAGFGQAFALLFGLAGLLWNPMLLFIALFVWMGAAQEGNVAQMKGALAGIPVASVMIRDFRTLSPDDPLERAVTLMLDGWQPDFPVVIGSSVAGVLRREDLLRALGRRELHARVRDVMRRDVPVLDSHDLLDGAVARLKPSGSDTLPVMHGGRLVGLLTTENVGEYLSVQAALGQRVSPRQPHRGRSPARAGMP